MRVQPVDATLQTLSSEKEAGQDPDFDPAVAAVYYLRVLQNPSCRWSHYDCLALPEHDRPAACSDQDLPWQVQERAWTSPVWYQPSE